LHNPGIYLFGGTCKITHYQKLSRQKENCSCRAPSPPRRSFPLVSKPRTSSFNLSRAGNDQGSKSDIYPPCPVDDPTSMNVYSMGPSGIEPATWRITALFLPGYIVILVYQVFNNKALLCKLVASEMANYQRTCFRNDQIF